MRRTPFIAFLVGLILFASFSYRQVAKSSSRLPDSQPQESSRSQYNAIVRAIRNRTTPPQYTRLGGLIYIHGHGARSDWTLGCVALENEDIKELFDAVGVGTQVTILP
jgi:L,D-peptidoglycan transpeptidase YkuD (ErfK/YbiS/YcfS/YnhG family)